VARKRLSRSKLANISGDNADVAVSTKARDHYNGNTRIFAQTVDRGAADKTAFGY
jgi:hypothetical protein